MTPQEILEHLSNSGSSLVFDGCLKFRGNKAVLTDELRAAIAANRSELTMRLGFCPTCKEKLTNYRETDTYIHLICSKTGIAHMDGVLNKTDGPMRFWTENLTPEQLAEAELEAVA